MYMQQQLLRRKRPELRTPCSTHVSVRPAPLGLAQFSLQRNYTGLAGTPAAHAAPSSPRSGLWLAPNDWFPSSTRDCIVRAHDVWLGRAKCLTAAPTPAC